MRERNHSGLFFTCALVEQLSRYPPPHKPHPLEFISILTLPFEGGRAA
jgi:hypothetical protein